MKRITFLFAGILALAVFVSTASADSCNRATETKSASVKADVKTQAKQVSEKMKSSAQMAACAKALGMTEEELAKQCSMNTNCGIAQISVDGMKGSGCENDVKNALKDVPGVYNVLKVSHTDKMAMVCYDTENCKTEVLTKTVADKGYSAQIIPAVSNVTDADTKSRLSGCGSPCPAAQKTAKDVKTDQKTKKKEEKSY